MHCIFSSAAISVQLADASFPETDFEVVRGNTNVKWARIAPYPFSGGQLTPQWMKMCYWMSVTSHSCRAFRKLFIICLSRFFKTKKYTSMYNSVLTSKCQLVILNYFSWLCSHVIKYINASNTSKNKLLWLDACLLPVGGVYSNVCSVLT